MKSKNNVDPQKPVGKFHYFIVSYKIWTLLFIAICGYFILALLFAILYTLFQCTSASDFLSNLYFSLITQTTIGFGDIIPINTLGRYLTALQAILGMMYMSMIIAIIIYKLISIPERYIKIEEIAIFSPNDGTLRVRFLNVSKTSLLNVEVKMFLRVWLEREGRFATYDVLLKCEHIPVLEPFVPWNIATRPVEEKENYEDLEKMDSTRKIKFHSKYIHKKYMPENINNETMLMVVIRGIIPVFNSILYKTKTYTFNKILCGKYKYISPRPGEYIWENWGKYSETQHCVSCKYQDYCGLITKEKNKR